jgi:hypothetical protein
VFFAFINKVFPASVAGRSEQGGPLPSRVVKGHLTGIVLDVLFEIGQERRRFPISGILGIVSIEIANSVGNIPIASPTQVLLL